MVAGAAENLCDLSLLHVIRDPFPHVTHNAFIQPQHYEQLSRSFPTCPPKVGPTGFSLYWGDEGYAKLLQTEPAWEALFHSFHSQFFIDWCREQFKGVWESEGCRIDLKNACYVPYREDRIDKERPTLRKIEHQLTIFGFEWIYTRLKLDTTDRFTLTTPDACCRC